MSNTNAGAERPQLLVFGGPNGSGKSTINSEVLQSFPGEYVNADDIARTLTHIADPRERNLLAADIARSRREQALTQRRDLAYETVMSTEEKIADMTHARSLGYEVSLIFVITDDPSLNVKRVQNRVKSGGHDVPEDRIRQRYFRSLELLACAIEKAENVRVFDNSLNVRRVVFEKYSDEVIYHPLASQPPYQLSCQDRLEQRLQSWASLTGQTDWTFADASHGRAYSGKGHATPWHIAIQSVDGLHLHDRQLLGRVKQSGEHYELAYAYQHGKRLTE